MQKADELLNSLLGTSGVNRRKFLGNAGKGLLAATVIGEIVSTVNGKQRQTSPDKSINAGPDTIPIELKPRDASTEKKEASLPAPVESGKRIGYALVGLGGLTLGEIMPAFGSCKYSKPVALIVAMRKKPVK